MAEKTYTIPEALRVVADLYSFRLEVLRDENRTTRAGLRALANELEPPPEPKGDVVVLAGTGTWVKNPNGSWADVSAHGYLDRTWQKLIEDYGRFPKVYRWEESANVIDLPR